MTPIYTAIARSIGLGYSATQILRHISSRYPRLARPIQAATVAGYGTDKILDFVSNLPEFKDVERRKERLANNPYARQKRAFGQRVQGERGTEAIKTAAQSIPLAVGVGTAAYGLYQAQKAIRPSQILAQQRPQLPPPSGAGPTVNITPNRPGGGSAPTILPGQKRLSGPPVSPRGSPNIPAGQNLIPKIGSNQPSPTLQPQVDLTNVEQQIPNKALSPTLDKNVSLIKNLNVNTMMQNLLSSGLAVSDIAGVMKKILPKNKFAIFSKAEGGVEQAIQDYSQYLMENPQEVNPGLAERISTAPQESISPSQSLEETAPLPNEKPLSQNERIRRAAFDERKDIKTLKSADLKGKEFSLPTYRLPKENPKDFENRKLIDSAAKKAAKEIVSGKTFLDFPVQEQAITSGGYSVAADVLRFMAGISNPYEPILDTEEKEELSNSLFDPSIHGAQMTPNMVWNMLLSQEPKLATMERPKSVVGRGALKSGEMGSAEFRRQLTHKVYGILSGKNISPELSDKIEKVSNAVSYVDDIAKAIKSGNMASLEKEIEKLANDDDYFFSLFTEEVEAMAKGVR